MNTRIVFLNPIDNSVHWLDLASNMFDPKSKERQTLANIGTTFNSDEEIVSWIRNKDVPKYKNFKLKKESDEDAKKRIGIDNLDVQLKSYLIDISKFPTDMSKRDKWKHDPATGSIVEG